MGNKYTLNESENEDSADENESSTKEVESSESGSLSSQSETSVESSSTSKEESSTNKTKSRSLNRHHSTDDEAEDSPSKKSTEQDHVQATAHKGGTSKSEKRSASGSPIRSRQSTANRSDHSLRKKSSDQHQLRSKSSKNKHSKSTTRSVSRSVSRSPSRRHSSVNKSDHSTRNKSSHHRHGHSTKSRHNSKSRSPSRRHSTSNDSGRSTRNKSHKARSSKSERRSASGSRRRRSSADNESAHSSSNHRSRAHNESVHSSSNHHSRTHSTSHMSRSSKDKGRLPKPKERSTSRSVSSGHSTDNESDHSPAQQSQVQFNSPEDESLKFYGENLALDESSYESNIVSSKPGSSSIQPSKPVCSESAKLNAHSTMLPKSQNDKEIPKTPLTDRYKIEEGNNNVSGTTGRDFGGEERGNGKENVGKEPLDKMVEKDQCSSGVLMSTSSPKPLVVMSDRTVANASENNRIVSKEHNESHSSKGEVNSSSGRESGPTLKRQDRSGSLSAERESAPPCKKSAKDETPAVSDTMWLRESQEVPPAVTSAGKNLEHPIGPLSEHRTRTKSGITLKLPSRFADESDVSLGKPTSCIKMYVTQNTNANCNVHSDDDDGQLAKKGRGRPSKDGNSTSMTEQTQDFSADEEESK